MQLLAATLESRAHAIERRQERLPPHAVAPPRAEHNHALASGGAVAVISNATFECSSCELRGNTICDSSGCGVLLTAQAAGTIVSKVCVPWFLKSLAM